jgi:enamine deaminase RidA (YjgF/YER057c/UK114 family)
MSIYRLNPSPRWSDATVYEGVAHFVEVPADTTQGFDEQLAQVLALAERTLTKIGSNKSKLLSATIYLTDRVNVANLNRTWEAWLPKDCAPSRACVKVELLDPAMLVEIVFVAATVK